MLLQDILDMIFRLFFTPFYMNFAGSRCSYYL